ncbi:MAG: hypothetical protein HKN12_00900 [Gemmatimonadetes bacterium]|nr:hypothetical protein [Gemmatimonadota bacterium]
MKRVAIPVLLVLLGTDASALTKTARRLDDVDDDRNWRSGGLCTITYYNNCSGWIWTWSDFPPNSRVGKGFGPTGLCQDYGSTVETAWLFVFSPAPSGYGFTGTVSVETASTNHCPVSTLESQPFLPAISGWNSFTFGNHGAYINYYSLFVTTGPGEGNPLAFVTDAPSVDPGCYPAGFGTRSFRFGTTETPLCPGTPFVDNGLDAQLLWEVYGNAWPQGPVSVDAGSWGSVKALYR